MTTATKRSNRRFFFASLAVCLLSQPAPAQSTEDFKRAFAVLRQYQADLANVHAAASRPLGPYRMQSPCTWCSERAWWGFGSCTGHTSQTLNYEVDFVGTRDSLISVLNRANQNAGTLATRYAPTQAWLDGLPQFSQAFNVFADNIIAIQEQIKSTGAPTSVQRLIVTSTLRSLDDHLQGASTVLQSGTRVLADSLQQQSAYRGEIKDAINGVKQSDDTALANLKNSVTKMGHPDCVNDIVNNKFNPIRNDFSNSIQAIAAAFQKLDVSSQEAGKGLAVLLGSIVSSQTELKSTIDLVNAAHNDQIGSFLQRLHLAAAKAQWASLAANH
jgi:hypothetical protein